MRAILVLGAALLCVPAAAGPQAYLIKANPNELGVRAVVAESCKGVSGEAAQQVVEDVLVRSRITPAPSTLLLRITADCVDGAGVIAFSVAVDFVRDPDGTPILHDLAGYGSSGRYDEPVFLLEAIRMATERAIADYLRANFPEPKSLP